MKYKEKAIDLGAAVLIYKKISNLPKYTLSRFHRWITEIIRNTQSCKKP